MAIYLDNSPAGNQPNQPRNRRKVENLANHFNDKETIADVKLNLSKLFTLRDNLFNRLTPRGGNNLTNKFNTWFKSRYLNNLNRSESIEKRGLLTDIATFKTINPEINIDNTPSQINENIDRLLDQIHVIISFLTEQYRIEIIKLKRQQSTGSIRFSNRNLNELIKQKEKELNDLYLETTRITAGVSGLINQYTGMSASNPDPVLDNYTNRGFRNILTDIETGTTTTNIELKNRGEIINFLSYLITDQRDLVDLRKRKWQIRPGRLVIGSEEFTSENELKDYLSNITGLNKTTYNTLLDNIANNLFNANTQDLTTTIVTSFNAITGTTISNEDKELAGRLLESIRENGGNNGAITATLLGFRNFLSPNNQNSPIAILRDIAREQQIEFSQIDITQGRRGIEIEELEDIILPEYDNLPQVPPLQRYGNNQNLPPYQNPPYQNPNLPIGGFVPPPIDFNVYGNGRDY